MSEHSSNTTAEIRGSLAQAWRRRDGHGVWFYGTWLFNRYYGTAILVNVVVAAVCAFLTLRFQG